MTDPNRKKDVGAEIRRGAESLESAAILLREKDQLSDGGKFVDAAREILCKDGWL